MSNQKTKKITGKSFKLYDFKTYDGAVAIESQSSSSSDEEEKAELRKPGVHDPMFWAEREGETCSIFIRDFKPFFSWVADNWTQQMAATSLRH
jgi:hypothetical protein